MCWILDFGCEANLRENSGCVTYHSHLAAQERTTVFALKVFETSVSQNFLSCRVRDINQSILRYYVTRSEPSGVPHIVRHPWSNHQAGIQKSPLAKISLL
jgi:hypothetical protein